MLDFDFLASEKARALKQEEKIWKDAVWSPSFQSITQNMSDGEVETFIGIFQSVEQFANAVRQLEAHVQRQSLPPYSLISQEAQRAGLTPEQWVMALADDGK